jgi:hypothetical protein
MAKQLTTFGDAKRSWIQQEGRFGLLRPNQQWDVHDYYKPSHELSEAELLVHRQQISYERPGLPARASRAFKVLIDPSRTTSTAGSVQESTSGRRLTVRAVVRPEPNIEQLARALLNLAEQIADQEREDEIRSA